MTGNKTKPCALSPADYLAGIDNASRRQDCEQLLQLMGRVTGQAPVMWGTAIVGFGVHTYPLAGGKQGEICALGFSSRKGDISIYGVAGESGDKALLAQLGKHKLGKGCLYVARLVDIDLQVLEKLIDQAYSAKVTT